MKKDALIGLLFWFGYHEVVASIVSSGTGWNWWYFQPFVILVTVFMVAMTFGSQTRSDNND
jgi:hypothetical protein